MILAKKLTDKKKNSTTKGGKKIRGGFSFKKALAIAAGPLGWVWLARHKNDKELNEVKKRLEKYEPPKKTKKEKEKAEEIDDFPDDDDFAADDVPMENDDDFDLDDFE